MVAEEYKYFYTKSEQLNEGCLVTIHLSKNIKRKDNKKLTKINTFLPNLF